MKTSLVKLVDVILRRIQERPETPLTEKGMRVWLRRQGYTKSDIEAAIKMVRPQMDAALREASSVPAAMRRLSPWEECKLSREARAALQRLELYQLMSPAERELVLDQLGNYDGEIGIEELDYLISWLVCGGRDVETQQTIYNILEGRGDTLH